MLSLPAIWRPAQVVMSGSSHIEPRVCVETGSAKPSRSVRRANRRYQGVMNLDPAISGQRYGSRRRVIRLLRNRRRPSAPHLSPRQQCNNHSKNNPCHCCSPSTPGFLKQGFDPWNQNVLHALRSGLTASVISKPRHGRVLPGPPFNYFPNQRQGRGMATKKRENRAKANLMAQAPQLAVSRLLPIDRRRAFCGRLTLRHLPRIRCHLECVINVADEIARYRHRARVRAAASSRPPSVNSVSASAVGLKRYLKPDGLSPLSDVRPQLNATLPPFLGTVAVTFVGISRGGRW